MSRDQSFYEKWRSRCFRLAALGTLVAVLPMASGCYGEFFLTKTVYEFNGSVSDEKWPKSILFFVLIVFPVYELANLGDALILNVIDFWTEDGGGDSASILLEDGSTVSFVPSEDGSEAVLSHSVDGVTVTETRFIRVGEGMFEVRDAEGTLTGRIERTDNGGLRLLGV